MPPGTAGVAVVSIGPATFTRQLLLYLTEETGGWERIKAIISGEGDPLRGRAEKER